MVIQGLNPRQRVLEAVRHRKTDPLPRGELLVEEAFLDRLYPNSTGISCTEKMMRLVDEWGLDLVSVRVGDEEGDEGLEQLAEWVSKTGHFVMALVDGLFWRPKDPLSFQEFILGIAGGEGHIRDLIQMKKKKTLGLIQQCLEAGAHGVMVGDDLAYNRGPFVSPDDLRRWIFPGLQEIVEAVKKGNGVAFLHSCGNLSALVELILSCGFHCLHGLATSAGNDPLSIRRKTQKKLALMGIFEVDSLEPQEIKAMKGEMLPTLAAEGGYILGSAEGLSRNTPLDSFRALYS